MKVDPYADAPRLPESDPFDPRALFPQCQELELEIGPGRGWFMVERLELEPQICMLGLEIRRKWATIVDGRLRTRGLGTRGRVCAEDVRFALPRCVPACLSRVFVNFPDPWWKKKHHKRLVLTEPVIADIARALVPRGELFIQTDVEERASAYRDAVERVALFEAFEDVVEIQANPYGAQSPRERRVVADGLPVYRLRYKKRD